MSKLRTVPCVVESSDGPVTHWVSRVLCLLEARPGCQMCPHRQFTVRFQLRSADHLVACPIWNSEKSRLLKEEPIDYQAVRRETCFHLKPYVFCQSCPNSNPSEDPRTYRRWVETEERQRRIELELDEEERNG
jgi:hypothetical protein